MTNYKMKFQENIELAEWRLNAYLPNGEKFASHLITNDEASWLELDEARDEYEYDELNTIIHAIVPYSEAEGMFEFLGSLDTYAKQHEEAK